MLFIEISGSSGKNDYDTQLKEWWSNCDFSQSSSGRKLLLATEHIINGNAEFGYGLLENVNVLQLDIEYCLSYLENIFDANEKTSRRLVLFRKVKSPRRIPLKVKFKRAHESTKKSAKQMASKAVSNAEKAFERGKSAKDKVQKCAEIVQGSAKLALKTTGMTVYFTAELIQGLQAFRRVSPIGMRTLGFLLGASLTATSSAILVGVPVLAIRYFTGF